MELQEIQDSLIDILEKYQFKIIGVNKAPSCVKGWLALFDSDSLYVFSQHDKIISSLSDDEDTEKKQRLVVRWEISTDRYYKENGIGFAYATGGNSILATRNKQEIEKWVIQCLIGHNLYTLDELESLKVDTTNLFDFI